MPKLRPSTAKSINKPINNILKRNSFVKRRGRIVREFGIDIYILLYLKWITNKVLLYVKHRELCSVLYGSLDGREFEGECIHVYV